MGFGVQAEGGEKREVRFFQPVECGEENKVSYENEINGMHSTENTKKSRIISHPTVVMNKTQFCKSLLD